MKHSFFFLPALFFFCALLSGAETLPRINAGLRTEIYLAGEKTGKMRLSDALRDQSSRKLFTAVVSGIAGVQYNAAYLTEFGARKTGFSITCRQRGFASGGLFRTDASILWNMPPKGVFSASTGEAFNEGCQIDSLRSLRNGDAVPLGLFQSVSGERFIPLVTPFLGRPIPAGEQAPFALSRVEVAVLRVSSAEAQKLLGAEFEQNNLNDDVIAKLAADSRCRRFAFMAPEAGKAEFSSVTHVENKKLGTKTAVGFKAAFASPDSGIVRVLMSDTQNVGNAADGSPLVEGAVTDLYSAYAADRWFLPVRFRSFCASGNSMFGKLPPAGNSELFVLVKITPHKAAAKGGKRP